MAREKECPYFTIVMPVYGVEKYIKRAVESILNQREPDWELILVDDCSPDRSIETALEAAGGCDKVKVLRHERNKGLSAARNTGLDRARGTYIWFMDPDDYVDEDLLEKVRKSLEKNPAEVVLFGLIEEYYGKDGGFLYAHPVAPEERLFHSQEELRKSVLSLEQETLYGYAWNKFYRVSYLREKNIRYKKVTLIEDILFNIEVFMDIKGLNLLSFTPYHYAKRLNASLTNKFVPDYFELHRRRIQELYDQQVYWRLCTLKTRQVLGSLYGRYILSAMERNCDKRSGMNTAARYRWCRDLFRQPLFLRLIPEARSKDSRMLALALGLMKHRLAILCLLMARGVHIIRGGLPAVYSKVKSGR